MSHVTDIILTLPIDSPKVEFVWLKPESGELDGGKPIHFTRVDGFAGGDRAMQCDVYLSAMNYPSIPALLRWFMKDDAVPLQSQMMVKDEHEDMFTVYSKSDRMTRTALWGRIRAAC
jgi:hypothetical protein